jgi:quinol monooxygenase YgiN
MAVALVFNGVGVTQAQYEQVRNEVSPDGHAPGVLFHAAGPSSDGWRVVEIWESQEAMQQFFQEKLGAAMQRANISAQPEFFEVQNMMAKEGIDVS